MLKLSLTIAVIALSFTSYGQKLEADKKVAELGIDHSPIDLYQKQGQKNVNLVFLNRKYPAITDVKNIMFNSKEDFTNFIVAMKSVDLSHKYTCDNYKISAEKGVFGAMSLTISNKDSSGYFYVSTKSIKYYEAALTKLQ